MKGKRIFILVLCLCVALTCAFTACKDGGGEKGSITTTQVNSCADEMAQLYAISLTGSVSGAEYTAAYEQAKAEFSNKEMQKIMLDPITNEVLKPSGITQKEFKGALQYGIDYSNFVYGDIMGIVTSQNYDATAITDEIINTYKALLQRKSGIISVDKEAELLYNVMLYLNKANGSATPQYDAAKIKAGMKVILERESILNNKLISLSNEEYRNLIDGFVTLMKKQGAIDDESAAIIAEMLNLAGDMGNALMIDFNGLTTIENTVLEILSKDESLSQNESVQQFVILLGLNSAEFKNGIVGVQKFLSSVLSGVTAENVKTVSSFAKGETNYEGIVGIAHVLQSAYDSLSQDEQNGVMTILNLVLPNNTEDIVYIKDTINEISALNGKDALTQEDTQKIDAFIEKVMTMFSGNGSTTPETQVPATAA